METSELSRRVEIEIKKPEVDNRNKLPFMAGGKTDEAE